MALLDINSAYLYKKIIVITNLYIVVVVVVSLSLPALRGDFLSHHLPHFLWAPAIQATKILAPVVQTLDTAAIQRISIRETNCTIHWIEIYRVGSAIQPLNNRGLVKDW